MIWNWCGISGSRGSDWKMQEAGRKNESLHEPGSVKGLRKMNGISKKEFSEYFGKSLEDIYGEPICKLESLKLLEQDDDRVWLTKRGIDVSNSVFVEFLLEE